MQDITTIISMVKRAQYKRRMREIIKQAQMGAYFNPAYQPSSPQTQNSSYMDPYLEARNRTQGGGGMQGIDDVAQGYKMRPSKFPKVTGNQLYDMGIGMAVPWLGKQVGVNIGPGIDLSKTDPYSAGHSMLNESRYAENDQMRQNQATNMLKGWMFGPQGIDEGRMKELNPMWNKERAQAQMEPFMRMAAGMSGMFGKNNMLGAMTGTNMDSMAQYMRNKDDKNFVVPLTPGSPVGGQGSSVPGDPNEKEKPV